MVFAIVLSALLSGAAAAQEDVEVWDGTVEVSPGTLTIEKGKSLSYRLRLSKAPTSDGWFVRVRVDGVVYNDGLYKGIRWVPSVGWEFNQDNWDQWREIHITARDDAELDTPVKFTHEVWEDDSFCPVHNVGPVTVTVTDDDGTGTTTPPSLSIDDATVAEASGATAVFTVTLSETSDQDVTVNYATSNGTAAAGSDYTASNGTLTIQAGSRNGTIRVPILDDSVDEANETFTVTLNSPTNATISGGSGRGTITDNDDPPSLRINDVTVMEASGATAVFTVRLSAVSGQDVTVNYATSDGTADAGSDYTSTGSTLTIQAGSETGTITVPILDDSVSEPNETFTVTLSSPTNATLEDNQGTGTITEDDLPPSLRIDDVRTAEASGAEAEFRVTLSGTSSQDVTVTYTTVDGTAEAGSDYTSTSSTLTIQAGSETGTITVPILDDALDEPTETFTVRLSNPTNATISDDEGVGTITDNNAPPSLSIEDATVTEASGAEAVFTVTLSGVSGRDVTVAYATSNGTAVAGSDYTATSSTLTISAGTPTGTITVPILDDALDEPNETFTVRLSAPNNATISDSEGTGTITDNDASPSLSIDDAIVAEASGARAEFTVTLSEASGRDVTVAYATSNGTAAAGSDYTATSSTLTIRAGSETGTIRVPILNDALDEPTETFTVTLRSPTNATISDDEGTGTITDNDAPSSLRINDATAEEAPGAAAEFTVTLSAVSGRDVTVNYATSNGTAVAGSDYTATSSTLTIQAGSRTGTIQVPILDDSVDEPNETFTVRLSNPTNATISDDEGVGTIADNDGPPSLSIDDATVTEASGAVAEFTVRLSEASGQDVTVNYTTSNGTAVAGSDYTASNGMLTIQAGSPTGTITVPILDDSVSEANETFTVRLRNPGNATISDNEGVGTITDNDASPSLRINDVTVMEASGAAAVFTVTLSAASGQVVTVNYATSDGTAEAGSDYTASNGMLTIQAGSRTRTITVPIRDDTVSEPDETFTVTLSSPTNATLEDNQGTGTITEDDLPPSLRIDDVSVTEASGASAVFTVTLSGTSSQNVTVAYATVDGTAAAGSDYTTASSTLTIQAGSRTGTITVPVLDDALDESAETFTVRLSSPTRATISDDEGVGTITDDDAPPSLSIDDATEEEASGAAAVFTVTLSGVSGRDVTVNYATSNGTAVAGSDYTATGSTLTIQAGSETGTITVPILNDAVSEPAETFTVTLNSPTNATISDDEGVGTITDNDALPSLRINDVIVMEASGARAVFTVTLSAVSGQVVTVDYATSDGTAVAGSDYTATSSTLTIQAGSPTGTIRVPILNDALDEPDETFTVRLSNPGNATLENQEGVGTITEDDLRTSRPTIRDGRADSLRPTLRIDDAPPVAEASGAAAVFTVTLIGASGQDVTAAYATSDGTAVAGSDYTRTSGKLTFAPGETEQTITVPILDDAVSEPAETFTVTLSNPVNATVADDEGTGTIIDAVTVSYGAASYTVTEGEFIEVTVVLSAPPGRSVAVPMTHMPDGGAVETDYSGVPENVLFGPSETQKAFAVRAVQDAEDDDGEKVVLGFGGLPPGVTAADPETAIVTIEEDDHAPDATPRPWLARFGRTAAAHVVDALDERMRWLAEPPRCPPEHGPRWRCRPPSKEPRSVVIGGHRLESGTAMTEAFGQIRAEDGSDGKWTRDDGTLGDRGVDAFRSLTASEILAGSSFHVSSEEEGDGRRFSFWGRGAFSRFDGRDDGLRLGGDVTTATLGADVAVERWLAGIVLSHSRGEGTFPLDGFEGEAASSLTGFYPYLRYGVSERLSIWGMAGYGAGTLTFTADDADPIDTGIAMMMGAAGARGELPSPADGEDLSLTLKADVLVLRTVSDGVSGLSAAKAGVSRLRLGLEGSYELVSEGGEWLSPFIEAGLRHDGGDAETGFGVEIGGGLRYAHPELDLTAELNARGLLTHATDGFAVWGMSGSLRYDPHPSSELGLSFTLSPSWGATASDGVDALWKRGAMADLAANDDAGPGGRIVAELGYGLPVLGGSGTGTPLAGVALSETGRDFRLGYRLGFGSALDMGIEGALREIANGNDPPEYGIMLRGALRW